MPFEVTNHDSVPPKVKTGLTDALRNLSVNQSIHIPADGGPPSRQRNRIGAICQYVGEYKFSVRIRQDRSFDIYRIE